MQDEVNNVNCVNLIGVLPCLWTTILTLALTRLLPPICTADTTCLIWQCMPRSLLTISYTLCYTGYCQVGSNVLFAVHLLLCTLGHTAQTMHLLPHSPTTFGTSPSQVFVDYDVCQSTLCFSGYETDACKWTGLSCPVGPTWIPADAIMHFRGKIASTSIAITNMDEYTDIE